MLFNLRSFLVRNSHIAFFANRYILFPLIWVSFILCTLQLFSTGHSIFFYAMGYVLFAERDFRHSSTLHLFSCVGRGYLWHHVMSLSRSTLSFFDSVGLRPPDDDLSICLANYIIFMKCDCSLTRKLILFQNMIWLWVFYLAIHFSG